MTNAILTMNFILNTFGDNEFTNKEFRDNKSVGMCVIDTLTSSYGLVNGHRVPIVQKVREESFSVEVKNYDGVPKTYIVDRFGKKAMMKSEFDKLPLAVRNLMETLNEGEFSTITEKVKIVSGVRYYYRVNREAFANYIEVEKKNLVYAIEKTEKAIVKLHEKLAKLETAKSLI